MWSQVFHCLIFLPAVAGAEAGSSPEAEVGNLHRLVLHHTGAVLLLLEKGKLGIWLGEAKEHWVAIVTWVLWLLSWLRRLGPSRTLRSHLVLNCFSLLHLGSKTIFHQILKPDYRVE